MKFKKALLLFGASMLCGCSTALNEPQKAQPRLADKEEGLNIYVPDLSSEGDTALITYQGKNILIDAGPDSDNGDELFNMLNKHVGEKGATLDYVIITHQDKDHVYQFSAEDKAIPRWLKKGNTIGCLIDFDVTKDKTKKNDKEKELATYFSNHISNECKDYIRLRDKYRIGKNQKIKSYYSSTELERQTIEVEKGLELKILYNKYSHEKVKKAEDSDNDYGKGQIMNAMSVCTLFTLNKTDKFLFTGDLIEFDSATSSNKSSEESAETGLKIPSASHLYPETALIDNNYDDLKDGVLFYKGGHHGSKYSNSSYFMDTIRPQHIAINAGKKYLFPDPMSLLNMTKWTDKIYIPSYYRYYYDEDKDAVDMKKETLIGDIHLVYDADSQEKLYLEGNNNYSIFAEEIMKHDRMFTVSTYLLTPETKSNIDINCSYVKIGHIDIVIGMGYRYGTQAARLEYYKDLADKIKYLCNDKIIEYVVVPTYTQDSYGFLVQDGDITGLFNESDLKVDKVIYHKKVDLDTQTGAFDKALSKVNGVEIPAGGKKFPLLDINNKDFYLNILAQSTNTEKGNGVFANSLATHIQAKEFNYLNIGTRSDYGYANDANDILNNDDIKGKINLFELPKCGRLNGVSATSDQIQKFITEISDTKKVNKKPALNLTVITQKIPEKSEVYRNIFNSKNSIKLYPCKEVDENGTRSFNGQNYSDLQMDIRVGTSIEKVTKTKAKNNEEDENPAAPMSVDAFLNKINNENRIRITARYNSYGDASDEEEKKFFLHPPVLQFNSYAERTLSKVRASNEAKSYN